MDHILESLINRVKEWLADMNDEQRLVVFERITAGYCRHCGSINRFRICHCQNDE